MGECQKICLEEANRWLERSFSKRQKVGSRIFYQFFSFLPMAPFLNVGPGTFSEVQNNMYIFAQRQVPKPK